MTHDRLLALWDHLGLDAAHVATQMAGDIAGLVRAKPERVGGVVLCAASRLDPEPFAGVADRLWIIGGSAGMTAQVAAAAAVRLPGVRHHVLTGYDAPGWADVVADRTAEIVAVLDALPPLPPVALPSGTGSVAGISYAVRGDGPPLVLLPFFLAPSQWEPALDELSRRFTTIVLGGRHLGGVAALEDRASGHSYRTMAGALWDAMAIRPDDTVLDVGCGSGALDRLLTRRLNGGRIVATDLNRFLLKEAALLADGLPISFQQANAESLPFPNASFDAAFTITVLEECDADLALRELYRVVKPGGRVGVIVRAIDLPQWWNLDLPDAIRQKTVIPPQSVGRTGVADASLYPRMRRAGFQALQCFPSLVTFDNPDGPIWRYREDHAVSQLIEQETAVWRDAAAAARRDGLLFMSNPLHCAAGTKPKGDIHAVTA